MSLATYRMSCWIGSLVALAGLSLAAAGCPPSDEEASAGGAVARRKVTVAAAADLRFALDGVAAAFREEHEDIEVALTYGSSGSLFAQIGQGAPFDVFLSADVEYPRRLAAAGHAPPWEVFVYAVGRLAVWVPAGSPLDLEREGMRALLDPRVRNVAIANPEHAPYGRAAVAAMRSLGVYDGVAEKLVLGESVAQAAQFVQSGAADAGVIALSLALASPMREAGREWEVPRDAYPRMEQGGVVLARAQDPAAAAAFFEFLEIGRGRELLRLHGFSLPEEE